MKIGIDFDGVMVNTDEIAIQYAEKFADQAVKNDLANLLTGSPTTPESRDFILSWIYEITDLLSAKPNATEVIKKLRAAGNDIIIITARSVRWGELTISKTEDALRRNRFEYDKVVFEANGEDKAKICQENGIDIFIDDSLETCEQVANVGIRTFLFTTEINQSSPIPEGVERVQDWSELYEKLKRPEVFNEGAK
jgi:uncharacterized HAD superfamily protein